VFIWSSKQSQSNTQFLLSFHTFVGEYVVLQIWGQTNKKDHDPTKDLENMCILSVQKIVSEYLEHARQVRTLTTLMMSTSSLCCSISSRGIRLRTRTYVCQPLLFFAIVVAMDFFDGAWVDDDMLWITAAADEIDAMNNCEPVSVGAVSTAAELRSAESAEHVQCETDEQRLALYAQLYQDGRPLGDVTPPRRVVPAGVCCI
jgi:hypothetical protein